MELSKLLGEILAEPGHYSHLFACVEGFQVNHASVTGIAGALARARHEKEFGFIPIEELVALPLVYGRGARAIEPVVSTQFHRGKPHR